MNEALADLDIQKSSLEQSLSSAQSNCQLAEQQVARAEAAAADGARRADKLSRVNSHLSHQVEQVEARVLEAEHGLSRCQLGLQQEERRREEAYERAHEAMTNTLVATGKQQVAHQ